MAPDLRALRRALRGFLTPPTAIPPGGPEALQPARRAVLLQPDPGSTAPLSDHLHLLSYNLQRVYREPEVVRTLVSVVADHRPDVVVLQEVPRGLWSHPGLEPVFAGRYLFYAPFHRVERPAGKYRFPEYGQVIASRVPLSHTEVVELPTVTRAGLGRGHRLERIALLAELPLRAGGSLRLTNVHHEPFVWPAGRGPQHEALLERLQEPGAAGCAPRIELCVGDFNATFGVRREPGLAPWWPLGFEAALPRGRHLDNALARGHRGLRAARLRRPGSDHRPLVVQVKL